MKAEIGIEITIEIETPHGGERFCGGGLLSQSRGSIPANGMAALRSRSF